MDKLSDSKYEVVRARLARNHSIPQGYKERLSKDPSSKVKQDLIGNSGDHNHYNQLGWKSISNLVKDPDASIIADIAAHPQTPITELDKLSEDKDEDVREVTRSEYAIALSTIAEERRS
jgi:hypothetical protein